MSTTSAPEMNKEYLDNIINGTALDELTQEQKTEEKANQQ